MIANLNTDDKEELIKMQKDLYSNGYVNLDDCVEKIISIFDNAGYDYPSNIISKKNIFNNIQNILNKDFSFLQCPERVESILAILKNMLFEIKCFDYDYYYCKKENHFSVQNLTKPLLIKIIEDSLSV